MTSELEDHGRHVDTGLVLGLGYGIPAPAKAKNSTLVAAEQELELEPSLTLGQGNSIIVTKKKSLGVLGGGHEEQSNKSHPSSPQSMASSLSNNNFPNPTVAVKRERDAVDEEVDEEAAAKKKLRLSKEQSALLEERFKEHSTLNPKQKVALAKQLSLRPRQVEVWFQNRRARTKLKQTEVDCEFLKRCCTSLTEENRRLQSELQQLRAMKLAAPLYMQINPPAAALRFCPSCERTVGGTAAAGGATSSDNSKEAVSTTIDAAPKGHHFYSSFSRTSSSAAC